MKSTSVKKSDAFIRMPKALFESGRYSNLSNDAKLLYAVMLDRLNISVKNNWKDKNNNIYIYMTTCEAMNWIGVSKAKCTRIFSELDDKTGCGLIHKVKQGFGKPARIYVTMPGCSKGDCKHDAWLKTDPEYSETIPHECSEMIPLEYSETIPLEYSEMIPLECSETIPLECSDLNSNKNNINKTEINKTEINNTELNNNKQYTDDSQRINHKITIRKNIDYPSLVTDYGKDKVDTIVDAMLDAISRNAGYVHDAGISDIALGYAMFRLCKVHVADVIENTDNLSDKKLLLCALYNAYTDIAVN